MAHPDEQEGGAVKGYAEKNPHTQGCFILIRSPGPPLKASKNGNKSRVLG